MKVRSAPRDALDAKSRRQWFLGAVKAVTLGVASSTLFSGRLRASPATCTTNPNALDEPPVAKNAAAVEVLRVWALEGEKQQVVLKVTWKEPGAWGLLLADVAGHAANAYAEEGRNRTEVFKRIIEFLNAEVTDPTDTPKKL